MSLRKLCTIPKIQYFLLLAIGVSNIGDWIYLISLNLIVLDMTKSPLAVSILYILKPLAALFTNVWAGSVIDRLNKRNLMVALDIIRAVFIVSLPFFHSIWSMYLVVFFINVASSIFVPTSMTYITKLTPPEQRKQFNSLRSLVESGGFLVGPAVAGMLFLIGTPQFAIYTNALALFLSGIITLWLPNIEKQTFTEIFDQKLTLHMLKDDWKTVIQFSRRSLYVVSVYFVFSGMIVMATAVDSLEAAFAKEVLSLSNDEYGFLVSIAGAGVVVGAVINTLVVKKLSTPLLMGLGSLIVAIGYIAYAFSNTFVIAAFGFFLLSFAFSYANTGFHTFYQNNIPIEIMGRVGSIYRLLESFFIILTTAIFGIGAQLISIRTIVVAGTLVMLLIAIMLCAFCFQPSKKKHYVHDSASLN